jgi:hypothetical protein
MAKALEDLGIPPEMLDDADETWLPTKSIHMGDFKIPAFRMPQSTEEDEFQHKILRYIRDREEDGKPTEEQLLTLKRIKMYEEAMQRQERINRPFVLKSADKKSRARDSVDIREFKGVALLIVGTHGEIVLNKANDWELFESPLAVSYINQTSCGIVNYGYDKSKRKVLAALKSIQYEAAKEYSEQIRMVMNSHGDISKSQAPARYDSWHADYMADRTSHHPSITSKQGRLLNTALNEFPMHSPIANKNYHYDTSDLDHYDYRNSFIVDPFTKRHIELRQEFSLKNILHWFREHGIEHVIVADYSCNNFHTQEEGYIVTSKGETVPWRYVKGLLTEFPWKYGGNKTRRRKHTKKKISINHEQNK